MSIMVFLIAAIPAAFIIWVGRSSTSRFVLLVAAALAAAVGIFTGSPIYTGVDLLGVAIGFSIGCAQQNAIIKKRRESQLLQPEITSSTSQNSNGSKGWIVISGIIGAIAYFGSSAPSTPKPEAQLAPVKATAPTLAPYPTSVSVPADTVVEQKNYKPQSSAVKVRKAAPPPTTVVQCIQIPSESEMNKCLNKVR